MNLKNYTFTCLLLFGSFLTVAQPTIYSQLCALNQQWKLIEPKGELLEHKQFSSEKEIITYHLQQAEKHLTKRNTTHLTKEVQACRNEGIAVLKEYWQRALYPRNSKFNNRIPFFIDDYNTACAVGYIMQGTGNEALANYIAETQNNAYVKEMVGENIFAWAKAYGFTVDELALIQPTYHPCEHWYAYSETVSPTCGNSDGKIEIKGVKVNSFEWEHGANTVNINNIPAGIYTITGTYIVSDNYWEPIQIECPFDLDIKLESKDKPDVTVNVLNSQSCEEIIDGMAEVVINNANGNYNVEWSNGATTEIAANLTTGFHIVSITDKMNCTAIVRKYVGRNSPLKANPQVSGTVCNNNTGSTNLNISGGSPPLTG